MDVIKGDGSLLENIDLSPANEHQAIIQNIAIILDTIQNSCPMFRGLGLPGELYGRPLPAVENVMVGYIYDQIEEYEPRADISEVTFERDELKGTLIPVIYIEGVNEEDE